MSRLAVIGDIGGHLDSLRHELARLGVPDDGAGPIPADLRIIQVGDLVHRGPDSPGVIALVDAHLRGEPCRWIQLVGNHEAHYLRRQQFTWPERLPRRSIDTLRGWWSTGRMRAATTARIAGEDFVITHAGVTRGFWRSVLGSPPSAFAAAEKINALIGVDELALFRSGTLVNDRDPDPLVGPVWAAAGSELVAGWLGHELPFNQLHGHTSVFNWDARTWYVDPEIQSLVTRDDAAKHVTVTLSGRRLVGIDPGHEALGRGDWRSFESVEHR